jgi:hypothetical protein
MQQPVRESGSNSVAIFGIVAVIVVAAVVVLFVWKPWATQAPATNPNNTTTITQPQPVQPTPAPKYT